MNLEEIHQRICSRIDDSICLFEKGEEIDIKQINRDVIDYCNRIKELPKIESISHDNKIKSIIEHFNVLISKLEEQKAIVGEKIDNSNKITSSQLAYNKALLTSSKSENSE